MKNTACIKHTGTWHRALAKLVSRATYIRRYGGDRTVIHFPPDASQLFKNCRPSAARSRGGPGSRNGRIFPGARLRWDHFELVLHRFVRTIRRRVTLAVPFPSCKVRRRAAFEHSLVIENWNSDSHPTDHNSTLTDKDCRIASARWLLREFRAD